MQIPDVVTIGKVLPCSIHSMSSRLIGKAQLLIKARAEDSIRETLVQHRVDVDGIMMVMLGGGIIIVVDVVVVKEHTTG